MMYRKRTYSRLPSFLPAASIQNQFGWFVVAGNGDVGRLVWRGGGGGKPMEEKYTQCRICSTLEDLAFSATYDLAPLPPPPSPPVSKLSLFLILPGCDIGG
jgi:hypothetical protein